MLRLHLQSWLFGAQNRVFSKHFHGLSRVARSGISARKSTNTIFFRRFSTNFICKEMADNAEIVTEPMEVDPFDPQPITRANLFTLTNKEQELFDLLMKVVKHYRLNVQLRVAGGWVRDKIMFSQSDDIDIALDTMMGKDFVEFVLEYMTQHGLETHHVGVIQTNPEQSKHLETATTQVLGVMLDFVNLRSEKYTDDSRIPQMDIGTPWQDSHRRDLTINSLFYNINTKQVEDWTRRGLSDLDSGIIRTPLPAFQTFMDDPLRVLRTIRFACRLGFSIEKDILEAGGHPDVVNMLAHKISRERIAKELLGMLKGPRPALAIDYMYKLGLFNGVFTLPDTLVSLVEKYVERGVYFIRQAQRLLASVAPVPLDSRRIFLLASILLPIRGNTFLTKKKKVEPASNFVMLESIKMTSDDTVHVDMLLQTSPEFHEVIMDYVNKKEFSRRRVGLLLRRTKYLWLESLYLSILHEMPDFSEPISENHLDTKFDPSAYPPALQHAEEIRHLIINHGLVDVWNMKPLIDGKTVLELLGVKPGPVVTAVTHDTICWQLDHPNGTHDECLEWLKSQKAHYLEQAEKLPTRSKPKQ